ncbi:OLC1v1030597C2 [Oldenlandia corymbosa var. corymbosa]|uniref:OLC1v1030597C2 n=1 Tax=Oldenlandia corymbosa var. corymbosa TaxID=529605 RepID=A0AAV1CID7_OLDCO|nr:OLC1v1030597C2 [Oldenlandia corymbosa var. corymbosa]
MATVSGSDLPAGGRSGGKIIKKRWRRSATTPYDRPPPPPPGQEVPHGSPNWLTGVIFPATRMIASGAVKMISSVFDSSSSSSSDSEGEGEGEGDLENVADEDNNGPPDDVGQLNKECMISSDGRNKEPQLTLFNSVTKSAIARLLMQERFSRQEGDALVQIIESRVLDPVGGEVADSTRVDVPVANAKYDAADLCTEAVKEARKWLEEKKVGSSPQSDLAHKSRTLNTVFQQFEIDTGSPVDYAKSYMKSRTPWTSPLVQSTELQTPFPLTRELFREGTSASFDVGVLPSSKKRNSRASGSWNIEEELRRLRSKASEDMLSSPPSTNVDRSSLQTILKFGKQSAVDLPVCGKVEGNMVDLVTDNQVTDAPRTTATELSSSHGTSGVDLRIDSTENDTLRTPSLLSSEEFQNVAVEMAGEHAGIKSKTPAHLNNGTEPCDDPRSSQRIVPQAEGVTEPQVKQNANGVHVSQARNFAAQAGAGDIYQQPDEGNSSSVNAITNATNCQVEDVCELLSEASVEVPIVDGTNGIVDVSKNVSSVLHEEVSVTLTQSKSDKVTDDGLVVKQEPKKPGKYTRRSRGRGK